MHPNQYSSLYDGELLLGEYDSADTMTAVNTWGANGLVLRRSGGSSVHYTWDAQGSLAQDRLYRTLVHRLLPKRRLRRASRAVRRNRSK